MYSVETRLSKLFKYYSIFSWSTNEKKGRSDITRNKMEKTVNVNRSNNIFIFWAGDVEKLPMSFSQAASCRENDEYSMKSHYYPLHLRKAIRVSHYKRRKDSIKTFTSSAHLFGLGKILTTVVVKEIQVRLLFLLQLPNTYKNHFWLVVNKTS